MSNYITIEAGRFEPFKENETDPKLKIWADKYFGIIDKVHDAFLEYKKRYAHLKELFDRINSLIEKRKKLLKENQRQYSLQYWDSRIKKKVEKQTREQLLHSSFKEEMDAVFDDSEIGFFMNPQYYYEEENEQDLSLWRYNHIVELCHSEEYIDEHLEEQGSSFSSCLSELELEEELRECLLHRSWRGFDSIIINESNIVNVECCVDKFEIGDWYHSYYCLKLRTGVWTTSAQEFGDEDLFHFIDQIKSKGVEEYLDKYHEVLRKEFSRCSIMETYKDFQSNKIEKIKKDKIKCARFVTRNEIDGIRVYD